MPLDGEVLGMCLVAQGRKKKLILQSCEVYLHAHQGLAAQETLKTHAQGSRVGHTDKLITPLTYPRVAFLAA